MNSGDSSNGSYGSGSPAGYGGNPGGYSGSSGGNSSGSFDFLGLESGDDIGMWYSYDSSTGDSTFSYSTPSTDPNQLDSLTTTYDFGNNYDAIDYLRNNYYPIGDNYTQQMLRDSTTQSLRERVGWVPGKTVVFSGRRALSGSPYAHSESLAKHNRTPNHENIFWFDEDGSLGNIGFFKDGGIREDDLLLNPLSDYIFDDSILLYSFSGDITPGIYDIIDYSDSYGFTENNYSLLSIGNGVNCQDFVEHFFHCLNETSSAPIRKNFLY